MKLSERTSIHQVKYNGGSAPRKIDLNKLAKQLLQDLDIVEESSLPQGRKTAKYKALATKFKNALFNDKRKYRGKSLESRIALKTYSSYLSRTRKLFNDRLHHNFFKEMNKLIEKYPTYSNIFKNWLDLPPDEIRTELTSLLGKLRDGLVVIDKYKPNSKNIALKKSYPEWAESIKNQTIIEDVHTGQNLYNELARIKINHEIMYHLKLDPDEKSAIKMKEADSLKNKKRNTVLINYPEYISEVQKILSLPDEYFMDFERKTIAPLAFALAAVSGRRMIEILLTGEFKRISKYNISFIGQAKKRNNDDIEREIYTLVDSKLFIEKIKLLRSCRALEDLNEIIQEHKEADDLTNEKIIINSIFSDVLSKFTKQFFNDEKRVFKDTRAIYARIVYEKYFRTDKRWKNVDEDVFFADILGHEDEETQLHYKQFKLYKFEQNFVPEAEENKKLLDLKKLDESMPGLARNSAAVKIHDWVKEQISINPNATITTYSIRNNLKARPDVAARYLDFAAEALGLVKINGRYEQINDNPEIIVHDNNSEIVEESNSSDDKKILTKKSRQRKNEIINNDNKKEIISEEQPQFTAQQLLNKQWLVQFEYNGKPYVWTGEADSMGNAIDKAWKEKVN